MKKLYEIIGQKLIKGDVGVEIEVEGKRLPDHVDGRWNATVDGSLRGDNREYVLNGPIPVDNVHDAVSCLAVNLEANKAAPNFSFRTSVHVHVNVQELTYPQYLSMVYTYFLLEEPLMTYCGKERKGNRFCLRMQDAEGMVETIGNLFRAKNHQDAFFGIPANQIRYSAINLEATSKYGSLEFRGMRGNMDADVISTWAKILVSIREFAKTMESPMDVYNLYAELEPQGFMEHVLKDDARALYYPKLVKDVQRSFSLSLDLPFAYADSLKKVVEEKINKAKKFDFGMGVNPVMEMAIPAAPRRAARIEPNPYADMDDDNLITIRNEHRRLRVPMPMNLIVVLEQRDLDD